MSHDPQTFLLEVPRYISRGCGGGLVVSGFASSSDCTRLNPGEIECLSWKMLLENAKINTRRPK